MTILARDLGAMIEIRDGGNGTVFELTGFRLPGVGKLAYKKFSKLTAAGVANLEHLIAFRDGLEARDRTLIDTYFTWPIETVAEDDRIVGFVMTLLTDDFFHEIALTSEYRPRDAQWLIASSEWAELSGVEVPEPGGDLVRLTLCTQLARAFALLHRAGVVYGDLHAENVLFVLRPQPRLRLVDCDGAKAPATADIDPQHHGQWIPPEGGPQTIAADCYKLGLFIVRCLADGSGCAATRRPHRAASALGPDGVAMLARAITGEPSQRPTAKEWFVFLRRLINERTQPPRIERVDVSEEVVRVGSRTTVSWQVRGALSVDLVMSDGVRHNVSESGATGSAEVAVARPGPIELVATNQYGSVTASTRVVSVVSPPTIEFVRIPEPPLPVGKIGVDRALIGTVVRAFDATPFRVPVQLPRLPDVVTGLTDTVPSLSHAALAVDVLALTEGLNAAMRTLAEQTETLMRNAPSHAVPEPEDAP